MKVSRRLPFLTAVAAAILLVLAPSMLGAEDKSPIAKYWKETGKAYPAAGKFVKAAKWAPGQYVITGTTTKGKYESVSRTLIVRKEGGGWVVETSNTDRKGAESVSQMLLVGFDDAVASGDSSKISITWMKMRDKDGSIQKIEGDQMLLFNSIMKSSYEKLVVNIVEFNDGGVVTVPGGIFSGTNANQATIKIMGMKITSQNWFHPSVPVNGLVKSQTEDGKSVTELLSFGTDGKPILE